MLTLQPSSFHATKDGKRCVTDCRQSFAIALNHGPGKACCCWQVSLADTNVNAVFEVHLPIGPPAALLRLDAGSVSLKVRQSPNLVNALTAGDGLDFPQSGGLPQHLLSAPVCAQPRYQSDVIALQMAPAFERIYVDDNGRAYGSPLSVRRLELSAGVITLPRHDDTMEQLHVGLQHDLTTDAGRQVGYSACNVRSCLTWTHALMSGTAHARTKSVACACRSCIWASA